MSIYFQQNKQKRSSQLLAEKEEKKPTTTSFPLPILSSVVDSSKMSAGSTPAKPQQTDNTVPKRGTVLARLAAFEKK